MGLFVALATWIVLNFLGLAIGLTVLEPLRRGALEEFGVGALIWLAVVEIVALFIGAYVASRAVDFMPRDRGLLHGIAVWGFTTIVAVTLGSMMVGSLAAAGADVIGRNVDQGNVAGVVPSAAFDENAVFGPINARLREQGKPELTSQQKAATIADATAMARRSRHGVDRDIFARALSRNTALTLGESRDLAARANIQAQQRRLERGAEQASDAAGRVFWALFIASILSLLAAIAGGTLGSRGGRRAVVPPALREEPVPATPPVIARPGEVYP